MSLPRPSPSIRARRRAAALAAAASLATALVSSAIGWTDPGAPGGGIAPAAEPAEASVHPLVSEVMTGGGSASDEFIEIYNPGLEPLPLDGLEVVYVTASGATVTRKASWALGAPALEPGAHLLIANEAGVHGSVADVTYANGLAATGGSVAIRLIGATGAIDAVGWGTAASSWIEGTAAPAPPAGSSLERLPGGAEGSTQDVGDNALDFVVRAVPDPQNSGSPPVPAPTPAPSGSGGPSPVVTASPTATPAPPAETPSPTASPTPSPTPEATPTLITVAEARALPDDTRVTIEAVSLTDGAFSEGGGYVADLTAGIAVLVADGTFPRGATLRVTGILDDRFRQRTLRAAASDILDLGPGQEPAPAAVASGAVGEPWEGRLVEVAGLVLGAPTELSGGLAYDLDDGTGPTRVLVGSGTAIDTSGWLTGTSLRLRGVVGQRDSSGTGMAGYRVLPRDADDVVLAAPGSPTPDPSGSPPPDPSSSPAPSEAPSVVPIAAARAAEVNARLVVSGVVTLPSGLSEPGSAVIQDSSAAILLRLGDEAGGVQVGELIQASGVRSTRAGMASLRVSQPPRRLGTAAAPPARRRATGALGEAD
ncbi:MAG: lamin tail domain-containing protein, partial [Candidatus Limnocylindria bacterium]